jgi:hypothetical protein
MAIKSPKLEEIVVKYRQDKLLADQHSFNVHVLKKNSKLPLRKRTFKHTRTLRGGNTQVSIF